ncbi:MAG: hypothetical protein GTO51_00845 [Candidatus Latescibacteria bacterium]|nr:hypothetical protein [Candidatus Latescibacterota bacterium]NIM64528.1 hypothetical protein [Candidatus Latescibacterota bacterium]NIO27084.1 hypothetical protein [Candidatus Latescibacterota bacterium]NIO54608.1 hypothetical protein [Candidatus Latescibacterota bacterium]NIT00683.1 hypothetical protein [Candidatus Latescibacterota bacterium]
MRGSSPEDALAHYIQEAGRSFAVEGGKRKLPLEFRTIEPKPFDSTPDMIVQGDYGDHVIEFWNFRRPSDDVRRKLAADEQWKHRRDGIYFVYGEGVRQGFRAPQSDIQDIAPTILYLLELPVSPESHGQVMTQVFETSILESMALYTIESYDDVFEAIAVSDEERESLEEKLRSLGYIR